MIESTCACQFLLFFPSIGAPTSFLPQIRRQQKKAYSLHGKSNLHQSTSDTSSTSSAGNSYKTLFAHKYWYVKKEKLLFTANLPWNIQTSTYFTQYRIIKMIIIKVAVLDQFLFTETKCTRKQAHSRGALEGMRCALH